MKEEKDNFGKEIKLAAYEPAPLQKAAELLKKLRHLWWAHNKIQSLSKDENAFMRQKVITLDLFRGHKTWDPARHFSGEYNDVKTNQHQDKYKQTVQALVQAGGDTQMNFSDAVIKVNRKGSSQVQVIVVTNANIYKWKPGSYKLIKTGSPISAVKAIHMSPHADSFIVIEMEGPHRDYVLDLGTNGAERVSELATILFKARYDQGKVIPVTFDETIKFNNSRTVKEPGQIVQLTFAKHPKPAPGCKFVGPNKGAATIFY